MGVVFGVDVGGTAIKIGMFDEHGHIKQKSVSDTDRSDNGKHILDDIRDRLDNMLQEAGLTGEDCMGIGIGLPGPVTEDGRILGCVNLGWDVFNVEERLSDMFNGIRVKAGNDANIAALGEQKYGGGKGYENVVMVTLGTGVGGGIILDGKVIMGTNGAAGEIGHIPVNPQETEMCGCGKRGCLEQYASASGIVRLAKQYLKKGDDSALKACLDETGELTAKDVTEHAVQGDALSQRVMEEFGKYLGMALASVACVINPDCMVIGGGVSKAGKFLLDIIEKNFLEYAFKPCRNVTFRLAELGNDAGIYGGAGLILEYVSGEGYGA